MHSLTENSLFEIFEKRYNDFREKVQGNFDIIQFADDTIFHFSGNNVSELEKCVSEILEKTDNYLKQNKLTMNTGKTSEHRNFFASRRNMKILIQWFFGDKKLNHKVTADTRV